MELTRAWATKHGGVYVRIEADMVFNPFPLQIPGLKVIIKDEEGGEYTLKNPALITCELSEIAVKKDLFKFKITSLKPLNPANRPDPFEQSGLAEINQGAKDFFRYMASLGTRESCLRCHTRQGYKKGDIRGGISLHVR